MSSERNSPDVTLALKDSTKSNQPICKHFQSGFCKFGDRCRRPHVNEICESPQCNLSSCFQRHPKLCKYYSTFSTCKFGDNCAYKHVSFSDTKFTKLQNEIDNLKASLQGVLQSLTLKEIEIHRLQEKFKDIEPRPEVSELKIPCNDCGKTFKHSSTFNTHIRKYHLPEVLRISDCESENPLNTSLVVDVRAHNVSSSIDAPFNSNIFYVSGETFHCDDCEETSLDPHQLAKHVTEEHDEFLERPCSHCGIQLPDNQELRLNHLDICTPCPGPSKL